jgi:hypothetical protein
MRSGAPAAAGGQNWMWEYYKKMYQEGRRLSDIIE